MVRQKIHTNRPILPIKPKMQQLRIPIHRPNTRNPQMDLPKMQNNTPQRHKRRKKYPQRRKKNNQKLLKLK